jgi:hypothetical protein
MKLRMRKLEETPIDGLVSRDRREVNKLHVAATTRDQGRKHGCFGHSGETKKEIYVYFDLCLHSNMIYTTKQSILII